MMNKPPQNMDQDLRRREFERLLKKHERQIFGGAMRLTGSQPEAEDLMQEAVVNAYLGFHKFELGTNFRAWMFRILRNTHINRYRRDQRTVDTIGWDDLAKDGSDYAGELEESRRPGPDDQVLSRVPEEDIIPALDELSEEFRTAVVLSDIHQYSYEEIAEKLDIPLGTVRSRIFRGRKRLREALKDVARRRRWL
ncbi:MAG: sigma-70 family RNA polymerase sigma factor [Armatimonadota bacterium]